MGLWSACASVGNIIGTLISSKMVLVGYEVAYCFSFNRIFSMHLQSTAEYYLYLLS